ncbi:MAG: pectate lyase [Bacteroidales bacterium]|nr:pectate lyase [Bacteroidales bacterium]
MLPLAFPGAEGGGMYTTGGRGGKVIHVTTLADSGAGSLRAALNESGPRTIVFDVAGIIELLSTLNIKNGDVTIAGQTAPGDGICLKNYAVVVDADNVIIRFIRFRMGDEEKQENDALWGRYHRNIIIDHCSMSWSTDECSSFYANEFFTMQWCILTESLRNSVHGKGKHGYGGIWGGKNASFHHNLLSCHDSRNPRIDHPQIYGDYVITHRGNVDYRCNAVYNWGSNLTYGGEDGWFNIVNNYYKPGPASSSKKYIVDAYGSYVKDGVTYADSYPEMYLSGNVNTQYPELGANDATSIYWHNGASYGNYNTLLSAPLSLKGPADKDVYTTTHSAEESFLRICKWGGASLARDAVDSRAASDAGSGTATFTDGGNGSKGGIIDTQTAVGGWPVYDASSDELAKIKDTDGDGMPDWFEKQFALDASNAGDGNAMTLDSYGRYTNLEMYLHYLVRDIVASQNEGGSYVNLR